MEIMLIVGIMGLLAAIAVPSFTRMQRLDRLRQVTRHMVGALREAKGMAARGTDLNNGVGPLRPARVSGIRFDSTTVYVLFLDEDDTVGNGNEVDVRVVNLLREKADTQSQVIQPIGAEIRFRADGRVRQDPDAGNIRVVISDPAVGQSRTIEVSGLGHVSMVE
jgi:Tfp pilus assembly protein FimT